MCVIHSAGIFRILLMYWDGLRPRGREGLGQLIQRGPSEYKMIWSRAKPRSYLYLLFFFLLLCIGGSCPCCPPPLHLVQLISACCSPSSICYVLYMLGFPRSNSIRFGDSLGSFYCLLMLKNVKIWVEIQ